MRAGLKIATLLLVMLAILVMPVTILPEAHAIKPATWVHSNNNMQAPKIVSSLAYYNKVSAVDCTHYASTTDQCSGTDTTYDTFSYTTPKSYGMQGSCNYPCESQDIYTNYPSTFTYNGVIYYFSSAQQDQCATSFGCSTETSWTSEGPVDVPYSGTPVDTAITVDTQVFYLDSSGSNEVEIEFTYNLDDGYTYG